MSRTARRPPPRPPSPAARRSLETVTRLLADARRAAGAEHAALLVRVGADLIVVATDPPVLLGPRAARASAERGLAGRVVAARAPIHVSDLAEAEISYPDPTPVLRGARSYLGVPLLSGERLLGVLELGSDRRRAFSKRRRRRAEDAARRLAGFLSGAGESAPGVPDTEGDPIAVVVHELRTPLTSLRGLSETLARGMVEDPELLRDIAARILRATSRLERRVSDLSDLARAGPGGLEISPVSFDAGRLLQGLVEEGPTTHPVRLDLRSEVPMVRADPGRLEQVLENLLQNARRYAPAGTEIVLTLERTDGEVAIAVRDRGPGIGSGDLDRIFEPFVRLVPGRGLGIGLTIARALMDAMGGTLEAESEPGRGSTFTVTVPAD